MRSITLYALTIILFCACAFAQQRQNYDGTYVDMKTNEMLVLKKEGESFKVLYSNGKSSFIPLTVIRVKWVTEFSDTNPLLTVQFPNDPKEYQLQVWTYERFGISCTNPDKSKQLFIFFDMIGPPPNPFHVIFATKQGLFKKSSFRASSSSNALMKDGYILVLYQNQVVSFYFSDGKENWQPLKVLKTNQAKRTFEVYFPKKNQTFSLRLVIAPEEGFGPDCLNLSKPGTQDELCFFRVFLKGNPDASMSVQEVVKMCTDCD